MAIRSEIRRVRSGDAAALLRGLREPDRVEWVSLLGSDPNEDELSQMIAGSDTYAGLVDGRIAGLYGVADLGGGVGMPWFLGTSVLSEPGVRAEFARRSKAEFARVARGYVFLWNYVAVENRDAVRWLRWLGFSLDRHKPVSFRGVDFQQFEMEF